MLERPAVCVFCGSREGARPSYREAARRTGHTLAGAGLGVVYGGGEVGLMGAVADAALEAGGYVVGVIPQALADREIAHRDLSELHLVADMHERKALMAKRSNGFLTLPGGVGTFEEFFEILTWSILGIHKKPMALLNIEGYFDPLLAMLDHAVSEQFLNGKHLDRLMVGESPEPLVESLRKSFSV